MEIRLLVADDVDHYREVRLRALRDHPTAYTTDYTEEAALSRDELAARIASGKSAVTFGAFDGKQLVGIATLVLPTRLKVRFRAMIAAMYVDPDFRRQGVATALIRHCLAHARTLPGLEEVCLAVTVGNEAARRVYLACGFTREYVEPRHLKYDGQYYDLEWLRLPLR